jgi:nodulation protein E
MEKKRVVITGLGVISAIGNNVPAFWDSIVSCRTGVAPIEAVDRALLRFENGCEIKNYHPLDHFSSKELDLLDRFSQYALIAAKEAIADAKIEWTDELKSRTCLIMGASVGGQDTQDKAHIDIYRDSKGRVHPLTIPRSMPNAAASCIAMKYGITGPTLTISTACASSNHAIGNAYWMVRNGVADMAITGGSEAQFSLVALKAWEAIRVVAQDTCRPFSKDRPGMILGEGGAVLILEELEMAQARGAAIYAEIIGFGMSSDAGHITRPEQKGAETAMRLALADAHILPEQINYINAHGTGTAVNDSMETAAIINVFELHANKLAISSTKSMHGHALAASGAMEAVATTLALKHQILPPTANFVEKDPECDLDVVPNASRKANINFALSNSFAFGGLNAVLAFRKWDGN